MADGAGAGRGRAQYRARTTRGEPGSALGRMRRTESTEDEPPATCLAGMLGHMKVTFDVADETLYRAIKVEAALIDRPVRGIVEEALAQWLERREDEEDRDSSLEALVECGRDGGQAADDCFRTVAAEVTARYGTG